MSHPVDPLFHAPDPGPLRGATDAADAIQPARDTLQRLDALAGELAGTLAAAPWSDALNARVLRLTEILGAATRRHDGESAPPACDHTLAAIEQHIEHVLRRSGWRINGKGTAAEPQRGRVARRNHPSSPG